MQGRSSSFCAFLSIRERGNTEQEWERFRGTTAMLWLKEEEVAGGGTIAVIVMVDMVVEERAVQRVQRAVTTRREPRTA